MRSRRPRRLRGRLPKRRAEDDVPCRCPVNPVQKHYLSQAIGPNAAQLKEKEKINTRRKTIEAIGGPHRSTGLRDNRRVFGSTHDEHAASLSSRLSTPSWAPRTRPVPLPSIEPHGLLRTGLTSSQPRTSKARVRSSAAYSAVWCASSSSSSRHAARNF